MEQVQKKRGFAAIDPQLQREIASLGGQTAHKNGNAHRFTSEEASAASLKSWKTRRARQVEKAKGFGTFEGGLDPTAFGPHSDNIGG